MKKSKLIGLSMTAVTLGIVGLAGIASAQTSTNSTGIIDKIATNFNLKKADVQAVFNEKKSEKQVERTADESARLQALVDKGTITVDQKTKIEAKQAELKTEREAKRTALLKWSTDNGIDAKYLMGGEMGGCGDHMGKGPMNDGMNQ